MLPHVKPRVVKYPDNVPGVGGVIVSGPLTGKGVAVLDEVHDGGLHRARARLGSCPRGAQVGPAAARLRQYLRASVTGSAPISWQRMPVSACTGLSSGDAGHRNLQ